MTERPIIFNAAMVRAIIEGRKTQTRRIIKPQPPEWATCASCLSKPTSLFSWSEDEQHPPRVLRRWPERNEGPKLGYRPRCKIWVREAWRTNAMWDNMSPSELTSEIKHHGRVSVLYEAGGSLPNSCDKSDAGRLRPSIHMPRWASRITLRVTDVRVERLNDISEEDARAEGIEKILEWCGTVYRSTGYGAGGTTIEEPTPRDAFRCLWNSINGPNAWAANPWVAAITFKRLLP